MSLKHANLDRAREIAYLNDPDDWPQDPICMKTVPWLPGERRYGMLSSADPLSVKPDNQSVETFASVEALLEVWTVD